MNSKDKSQNNVAIILLMLATLIAALFSVFIGLSNKKEVELPKPVEIVEPVFENISKDGSFVVTKEGISKDFSKKKNVKIEWYTDFLCPDCARAYNGLKEFLGESLEKDEIEVKFHVLNYLPQYSPENYPLNSASWVTGVAEHEPGKIITYMDILANDKTDIKERTGQYFASKATEVGISKESIKEIEKNLFNFKAVVNGASVGIRQRKDLLEKSLTGDRMFVPFILVNNGKALPGETENVVEDLIAPIKRAIENKETLEVIPEKSLEDNCEPGQKGCS